MLTDTHIHTYTLNGAHIASASVRTTSLGSFTFGGPARAAPRFCGGISFYQREFSKDGLLLAVGMGNNVSLWRLCPGTLGEPAWYLKEIKRLPGPEHMGSVTAISFIE